MNMAEGMTCYERDETFCDDQMCLRTGCRLRKKRLDAEASGSLDGVKDMQTWPEAIRKRHKALT